MSRPVLPLKDHKLVTPLVTPEDMIQFGDQLESDQVTKEKLPAATGDDDVTKSDPKVTNSDNYDEDVTKWNRPLPRSGGQCFCGQINPAKNYQQRSSFLDEILNAPLKSFFSLSLPMDGSFFFELFYVLAD